MKSSSYFEREWKFPRRKTEKQKNKFWEIVLGWTLASWWMNGKLKTKKILPLFLLSHTQLGIAERGEDQTAFFAHSAVHTFEMIWHCARIYKQKYLYSHSSLFHSFQFTKPIYFLSFAFCYIHFIIIIIFYILNFSRPHRKCWNWTTERKKGRNHIILFFSGKWSK